MKLLFATRTDFTALVARVALGAVMFPHGAQKLLGWFGGYGYSATMQYFASQGFPTALSFLAIVAEFFGSIGLIIGFLGRIAAFGIACVMAVAVATVHSQVGFFMNWGSTPQRGEGFEYHILAIALALVVMIKGSGALSVDRALSSR
jgi:putative oxidoreductase